MRRAAASGAMKIKTRRDAIFLLTETDLGATISQRFPSKQLS
jgi:hypothetical protein